MSLQQYNKYMLKIFLFVCDYDTSICKTYVIKFVIFLALTTEMMNFDK